MAQVEVLLNEQKERLGEQIRPLLVPSQVGATEIKELTVTRFRFVNTDLPARENRPPDAASYSRPDGSTVSISALASTQIEAAVETFNLLSWYSLIGRKVPADEPVPPPHLRRLSSLKT